jgi:hypothetical protein
MKMRPAVDLLPSDRKNWRNEQMHYEHFSFAKVPIAAKSGAF